MNNDRFCPNCGQKVDEGIPYCPNCGQSLNQQKSEAPEAKKSVSRKTPTPKKTSS